MQVAVHANQGCSRSRSVCRGFFGSSRWPIFRLGHPVYEQRANLLSFIEQHRFESVSIRCVRFVKKGPPVPAFGEAVDDLDVFMAGESEVDEPFAVEQSRRLLQQRNPPPVVLDQVVEGGKDIGYPFLNGKWRNVDEDLSQFLARQMLDCRAGKEARKFVVPSLLQKACRTRSDL